MSEPKPDEIENFCAIANTDPETAKKWLRRYSDLNSAVEAFFDNNGILPEATYLPDWDENAFHAGKNDIYGPENRPQPSFNIQGSDALSPGIFDASPSRPPSRVSAYPGNDDYSLRKFLKSGGAHPRGGQESGITDQAGGNFRRVEDGYANSGNWAMSLSKFDAREIPANSDPKERARAEGAPAFLKPTFDSDYLPGLLTIMQHIPMAKDALLAREISLPDYGNNSDWWDGDRIESARIMLTDDETPPAQESSMIHETQRLMSFLELTDRAYGSVASLLQEPSMFAGGASVCANFLAAWRGAMHDSSTSSPLAEVFTSVAINDPEEVTEDNAAELELAEIDLTVSERALQFGGTLYDAIDEMFWQESDEEDSLLEVHLRPAEVLCLRVHNLRRGANIEGLDVPPEFYPARYTRPMLEVLKPLRKRRAALAIEIERLAEKHHMLAVLNDPDRPGTTRSGIDLLDHAIKHFGIDPTRGSTITRGAAVGVPKSHEEEMLVDVSEGDPTPSGFTYGGVEQELRELLVRLGAKHQAINLRQNGLQAELLSLLRAYREPDTHPEDPMSQGLLERYTLRGVCTASDTTYVLANPSATEDLLDSPADQWQWWKLTYSSAPGTSSPASAIRVEQDDVLRAARNESTEIGLVYASDAALAHTTEPLPTRLRNFVRLDNLAFSRELDEAAGRDVGSNPVPLISSSSSASYRQDRAHENSGPVLATEWREFSPERDDEDEARAVDIAVSDDGVGEAEEPPPYDSAATRTDGVKRKLNLDLLADEDRVLPPGPGTNVPIEERKGG